MPGRSGSRIRYIHTRFIGTISCHPRYYTSSLLRLWRTPRLRRRHVTRFYTLPNRFHVFFSRAETRFTSVTGRTGILCSCGTASPSRYLPSAGRRTDHHTRGDNSREERQPCRLAEQNHAVSRLPSEGRPQLSASRRPLGHGGGERGDRERQRHALALADVLDLLGTGGLGGQGIRTEARGYHLLFPELRSAATATQEIRCATAAEVSSVCTKSCAYRGGRRRTSTAARYRPGRRCTPPRRRSLPSTLRR